MDGKYLLQKGRTWYVRLAIPKMVQDILGGQEFVKSLKTRDYQEAKLLKHKYLDRYAQMISIAKKQLGSNRSKEEQLIDCGLMLRQFNEKNRSNDDTWNSDVLESKLEELWGPEVAHSILNAHHHDYKGTQVPIGIVKALKDAYRASDPDTALLSLMKDKFIEVQKRSLKEYTCSRKLMNLERFIGWYGDKDIRSVQKKHVSEFLSELIERENYAKNTIDGILGDLSSFFNWAEGSGLIRHNPVTGVSKVIPRPKGKSINDLANLPYTHEMLQRWFDHIKNEPNILVISAIALYSGMRLDEICSLKKADLDEDCFLVTNGKTGSSIRKIPIHKILIPLVNGLYDSSSHDYLIKGLKSYHDDRSHYVGKIMTTRRKQLGFEKRKYTFHSFRSNFMTEMDNLGTKLSITQTIVGHTHKNLVRDVYSSGVRIERQRDALNRLSFGEIDNLVNRINVIHI